jgi:zinc transporter ZupT
LLANDIAESSTWILPFTAGGFIYIASVDVVPELLKKTTLLQSIMEFISVCFGIGMMLLICIYE